MDRDSRLDRLEARLDRQEQSMKRLAGMIGERAAEARGLSRRDVLEAGGYVGLGLTIASGGFIAGSETAAADAQGNEGTSADPLSKLWAHEIESGDGASTLNIPDSVDINQLHVDNATYVEAHRESDNSDISAGSWTNLVDTEDNDVRNELDSNQKFSPDASAEFTFRGVMWIAPGADGDRLDVRVQNVTDGSTVKSILAAIEIGGKSSTTAAIPFAITVPLNNSKSYEVQGADQDSSFDLKGGFASACYYTIQQAVVRP